MPEAIVDSKSTRTIRVENLPDAAKEADVRALFTKHGPVVTFERPADGPQKAPGWFAYVAMATADADKAITALNGYEVHGQKLAVSAVRPAGA